MSKLPDHLVADIKKRSIRQIVKEYGQGLYMRGVAIGKLTVLGLSSEEADALLKPINDEQWDGIRHDPE